MSKSKLFENSYILLFYHYFYSIQKGSYTFAVPEKMYNIFFLRFAECAAFTVFNLNFIQIAVS